MSASHGADQADTLRQLAGRSKGRSEGPQRLKVRQGLRVISITSVKAGVGKSSVAINLAESLASQGKRVLIVDADLAKAELSLRMGVEAPYNLQHVLSGERTMEETLVRAAQGIDILPAALAPHKYTALSPSGRFSLLQGMIRLQDGYDYYLVDTGAGVSANVTGFAAISREIMLVVTPELSSITDAYALMKTLPVREGGIEFRVLVNKCRNAEEGLALYKKLSMLTGRFLEVSMEYAGCILQDEMLVESVNRRGPVCRLFPDSRSALGFRALANKVMTAVIADALQMQIDQVAANKQWRNHELSS